MKNSKCQKNRGFTLVEVVVALALFSLLAAFIFPAILGAVRMNYASENLALVQDQGQSFLESLLFNAKSNTKDTLVDHYVHNNPEQTVYDDITQTLTIEDSSVVYTVIFSQNDNRIHFSAISKGQPVQRFETVEWLVYKNE